MNVDEKIIIENYGEKMWELCKELFPNYLKEQEGMISDTMLECFSPTISLCDDIILNKLEGAFKNLIISIVNPLDFDPNFKIFHCADDFYYLFNGKYYKVIDCGYNKDFYVFPGNTYISNGVFCDEYSKKTDRYIIVDKYLIDLKEKKISSFLEEKDTFGTEFCNSEDGKSNIEDMVVVMNEKNGERTIKITYDGGKKASIVVDRDNKMVEYHNHHLFEIPSFYKFGGITNFRILDTPFVKKIGDRCFFHCPYWDSLSFPRAISIGEHSFWNLPKAKTIIAPLLSSVGRDSFCSCRSLENFIAEVDEFGEYSFEFCPSLKSLDLSATKSLGVGCFYNVSSLPSVSLRKEITSLDKNFAVALNLTSFHGPNVRKLLFEVLSNAPKLKELILSSQLDMIEERCLLNSPLLPLDVLDGVKVKSTSERFLSISNELGVYYRLKHFLSTGNWSITLRDLQKKRGGKNK